MKTIIIEKNQLNDVDILDNNLEAEFIQLFNEYKILESHIVYFSAGDSKIKEILVKKEPSFSV